MNLERDGGAGFTLIEALAGIALTTATGSAKDFVAAGVVTER